MLISQRLTADIIKRIAVALDQLIEEAGREPRNVQIVVVEAVDGVIVRLQTSGVLLESTPEDTEVDGDPASELRRKSGERDKDGSEGGASDHEEVARTHCGAGGRATASERSPPE